MILGRIMGHKYMIISWNDIVDANGEADHCPNDCAPKKGHFILHSADSPKRRVGTAARPCPRSSKLLLPIPIGTQHNLQTRVGTAARPCPPLATATFFEIGTFEHNLV